MTEYDNNLPSYLTTEQKHALVWRIEDDFKRAGGSATIPKNEYIAMAVKFYTRNPSGLGDIVEQYIAYRHAKQKTAQPFMAKTTRVSMSLVHAA